MSNNKKNPTNPAIADKAFTFLRVFANVPEITKLLVTQAGFKKKDFDEGWALLRKVAHYEDDVTVGSSHDAASALRELNEWDDVAFRRARAALHRLHPEQETFVFRNLDATSGPQAVVGIQVFLDRLDALESSTERAASHAEDLAALQTLADRGLDKAERDRVRKLVELAISAPDIDAILASSEPAQDDVERLAAWYEDWAETARATITDRKDLLFRLGVAKRRKGRPSSEAAPPITTPVVGTAFPPPAPVAVPPANVAPSNGSNGLTNGASTQPTTPAVVIA